MDGQHLPDPIRPKLEDVRARIAIEAWNLMGGEIQWAALDAVGEMFGVEDVDLFVHQLAAIRDHQRSE